MDRKRASGKVFKLTRKFDGKTYSIYPTQRYTTKSEAEKACVNLRKQGYSARIVKRKGYYLIYQRKDYKD